jgi:hypothetical protein
MNSRYKEEQTVMEHDEKGFEFNLQSLDGNEIMSGRDEQKKKWLGQ